jgi:hypothetical protein
VRVLRMLVSPNIDLIHGLPGVRSMDCEKALISPLVFSAQNSDAAKRIGNAPTDLFPAQNLLL